MICPVCCAFVTINTRCHGCGAFIRATDETPRRFYTKNVRSMVSVAVPEKDNISHSKRGQSEYPRSGTTQGAGCSGGNTRPPDCGAEWESLRIVDRDEVTQRPNNKKPR